MSTPLARACVTIGSIAAKIACTRKTLRQWARRAEVDRGLRGGVKSEERERVKNLGREVRDLRRTEEILLNA